MTQFWSLIIKVKNSLTINLGLLFLGYLNGNTVLEPDHMRWSLHLNGAAFQHSRARDYWLLRSVQLPLFEGVRELRQGAGCQTLAILGSLVSLSGFDSLLFFRLTIWR